LIQIHVTRQFVRIKGDDLAKLASQAAQPSDPETTRKFLEEYDRIERPFRTNWRREILGVGISLPRVRVEPWRKEHLLSLEDEIHRCWFEVGIAFTYGLFQSALLMTCLVVELAIERYLRTKDLWSGYEKRFDEHYRSLGTLIHYCRETSYLTPAIIAKCSDLNQLRIEAAHMNKRRKVTLRIPPSNDPLNDMDEIENVTTIEKGEKTAVMALGEIGFLFDPTNSDIYKVRAFKRYAKQALDLTSQITKLIFSLY
jgi:hypothetical protein